MRNGFNIVIGGLKFNPNKFISDIIKPQYIEIENKDKFIEFHEYEEGKFTLDMISEAIDYLDIHEDYFLQFKDESTVEYRKINFFIETDFQSLYISEQQIEILHKHKFELSFTYIEPKNRTRNWS